MKITKSELRKLVSEVISEKSIGPVQYVAAGQSVTLECEGMYGSGLFDMIMIGGEPASPSLSPIGSSQFTVRCQELPASGGGAQQQGKPTKPLRR